MTGSCAAPMLTQHHTPMGVLIESTLLVCSHVAWVLMEVIGCWLILNFVCPGDKA